MGGRPGLQEVPVRLQFRSMNLGPGFDHASLGDGQIAAQTLDRVDREHCSVLLIVGVKMGAVMRAAGFDEHANHDAEESRQLRHDAIVACGSVFFVVGLTLPLSREARARIARGPSRLERDVSGSRSLVFGFFRLGPPAPAAPGTT